MNHQNDLKVRNRIKLYHDNIVGHDHAEHDTNDTAL